MKYTPRNPNEHKFKPSMAKLKGYQKKQPRKKKNKVDVIIKTNNFYFNLYIIVYFLFKNILFSSIFQNSFEFSSYPCQCLSFSTIPFYRAFFYLLPILFPFLQAFALYKLKLEQWYIPVP